MIMSHYQMFHTHVWIEASPLHMHWSLKKIDKFWITLTSTINILAMCWCKYKLSEKQKDPQRAKKQTRKYPAFHSQNFSSFSSLMLKLHPSIDAKDSSQHSKAAIKKKKKSLQSITDNFMQASGWSTSCFLPWSLQCNTRELSTSVTSYISKKFFQGREILVANLREETSSIKDYVSNLQKALCADIPFWIQL